MISSAGIMHRFVVDIKNNDEFIMEQKKTDIINGFKNFQMHEFPGIINVEVYRGACPCKCVHCPVGITAPSARQERFSISEIDPKLFEKIIDEVSLYSKSTLRIHSVGEPLLWNNLVKALKSAQDRSVKTWLFTSGVTTNKSLLRAICEYTDIIEVSVNSINSEDYKTTKGVDMYALVEDNLRYMHDYVTDNKLPVRLIVSRVQSSNQDGDREFVEHWKLSDLVNDAFVRSYHTYNDLIAELNLNSKQSRHEPCLVHWARFNISVRGYAVICFNELFKRELDPGVILGDINKETIADIWKGRKLNNLRLAELSGDYSGLSFRGSLPCVKCTKCQPLTGSGPTSEYQLKQVISGD